MFWNTTKIQTVYEWIFFYVKTTPYLRENDPAPHVFARRPRGLRLVLAVRQLVGTRLSRALEQLEQRRADPARRFDEKLPYGVTKPLRPCSVCEKLPT